MSITRTHWGCSPTNFPAKNLPTSAIFCRIRDRHRAKSFTPSGAARQGERIGVRQVKKVVFPSQAPSFHFSMSAAVLHSSNWDKLDVFYLDDAQILSWRHWTGQRWDGPYSLPETGRIDSKPTVTDARAVFYLRRYRGSLHLFGSIWNGAAYEPPEDLGEFEAAEIAAVSFSNR